MSRRIKQSAEGNEGMLPAAGGGRSKLSFVLFLLTSTFSLIEIGKNTTGNHRNAWRREEHWRKPTHTE
jgi:hypothetical protein